MSALGSVAFVHHIEEIVEVIHPFFFANTLLERIVKHFAVFPSFLSGM